MPRRPGPKPKPLHLVAGHRTQAELAEREASTVRPHPVAPKRPAGLTVLERECWDMHAPELDRMGMLTVLDAGSFRLACSAFALAVAALDDMRPRKSDGTIDRRSTRYEVTVADQKYGGRKRNPAYSVWAQASKEYRAWCGEFGLTPSSRIGLRTGAPIGTEPDDVDDDEGFFGT